MEIENTKKLIVISSVLIGAVVIMPVLFIYLTFFLPYSSINNEASKYHHQTFVVESENNTVSGAIKTRVTKACGETTDCVYVDYDLILTDETLPKNSINDDLSSHYSLFDSNYYYVANIYNNKLDPNEYSFDRKLKLVDKNEFEIKFHKVLYRDFDEFLELNNIDIYDVSDPAYLDVEFNAIDSFAGLKQGDKIKSYSFVISPQ